jgi:hypothetical protein
MIDVPFAAVLPIAIIQLARAVKAILRGCVWAP